MTQEDRSWEPRHSQDSSELNGIESLPQRVEPEQLLPLQRKSGNTLGSIPSVKPDDTFANTSGALFADTTGTVSGTSLDNTSGIRFDDQPSLPPLQRNDMRSQTEANATQRVLGAKPVINFEKVSKLYPAQPKNGVERITRRSTLVSSSSWWDIPVVANRLSSV